MIKTQYIDGITVCYLQDEFLKRLKTHVVYIRGDHGAKLQELATKDKEKCLKDLKLRAMTSIKYIEVTYANGEKKNFLPEEWGLHGLHVSELPNITIKIKKVWRK